MLLAVVVLRHGGRACRQHDPGLFRGGKDVDVRRQGIRVVERADADKGHEAAGAGVVAPEGDAAARAARYRLALAAGGRRVDQFRLAAEERHAIRLDHGVQGEGGAGFALAPATMAAVHEEWRRFHAIADAAAVATAFEREFRSGFHGVTFAYSTLSISAPSLKPLRLKTSSRASPH